MLGEIATPSIMFADTPAGAKKLRRSRVFFGRSLIGQRHFGTIVCRKS
jgi:hypothetical protein